MKIVFVGNHQVDYSSETHHCKTLESLGHEVIRLQEGEASSLQILETAQHSDLLIFIHTHGWVTPGELPIPKVFELLKALKIPTMTYHLDLWFGIQREKDLYTDPFYKTIEHFFATDKLMADWFNKNTNVKGHYIPAGVYDKEVYISDQPEGGNDVIFVGSKGYHHEWAYRPQLVNWLRDTYQERFTHVGGDGDTGTIRGDKLNRLYAASKVAVGDTLCINFNYPYYFSDRLFESTGRGGFTVFPYIKGIEDNFELGKEIVTYPYGDFDKLKEIVDYYCENDDERETIRRAGFERTKRDHTYVQRWVQILKELGL